MNMRLVILQNLIFNIKKNKSLTHVKAKLNLLNEAFI